MRKTVFFLVINLFFIISFVSSSPAAENGEEGVPPVTVSEEPFETSGAFEDDPFASGEGDARIADPLQPINRASFWFNDKLYFYLLKPVTRVYRVVPEKGRTSVANFFSNLASSVRFANCLLQFKLKDAGTELGRFALNTTVGVAGLFDPAKSLGMSKKEEDFGQTLGYYGVGQGFYLVIPVLGPSSLRDGPSFVVDSYFHPFTYCLEFPERAGSYALKTVNALSLDKDTYESVKKDFIDPYLFIRNAYAQRRAALIKK